MPFFLTYPASTSFCCNQYGSSKHFSGIPPPDGLILLASVALFRNWHQSCINDLASPRFVGLGAKMIIEQFKRLLNHPSMLKPLTEDGDSCCIWKWVHHAKPNKILKRTLVIDLNLKSRIAQIEELLKYQHLEKDQFINPLYSCIALSLLTIAMLKQR